MAWVEVVRPPYKARNRGGGGEQDRERQGQEGLPYLISCSGPALPSVHFPHP